MNKNKKIKIQFVSCDHKILDKTIVKICDFLKNMNIDIYGPIPMPTKKTKFALLRAPMIYKVSYEKYVKIIHKRIIIIGGDNCNNKNLSFLGEVVVPKLIKIKVKAI